MCIGPFLLLLTRMCMYTYVHICACVYLLGVARYMCIYNYIYIHTYVYRIFPVGGGT